MHMKFWKGYIQSFLNVFNRMYTTDDLTIQKNANLFSLVVTMLMKLTVILFSWHEYNDVVTKEYTKESSTVCCFLKITHYVINDSSSPCKQICFKWTNYAT